MFPPEAFQSLLTEIARVLESRGIRFALTGGLVSAFYSEPRYTQDADLVIQEDEADDLLESVDQGLKQSRRGAVSMLQVEANTPKKVYVINALVVVFFWKTEKKEIVFKIESKEIVFTDFVITNKLV